MRASKEKPANSSHDTCAQFKRLSVITFKSSQIRYSTLLGGALLWLVICLEETGPLADQLLRPTSFNGFSTRLKHGSRPKARSQKTPFHATRMQVDYKGASNIGKFHVHAYQSDNLGDCTSVGGHYNPTDRAGEYSNVGDNQRTYEVGDLSGKHGTFADWGVTDDAGSKVFYDVNLPLWGSNSVAARSVVLHDAASGARTACGNFGHMCSVWDRQPKYDEIKIDYNGEDVWGYQVLRQRKGCPWCATSVKSHFRYKEQLCDTCENADDFWATVCADTEHALFAVCETGSAESKFHIHTIRDEVNEWAGCNNNGGHYNPQVGVPCMSGVNGRYGADLCELGDLSNKLGKLVISNAGWTTSQTTDLYAPLTESSQGYQFSNRSITIHAPSGVRLACGPTDLE